MARWWPCWSTSAAWPGRTCASAFPGRAEWKVILDTSGYDEFSTPSQADVVLEAQEQPWDNQPYSVEVRVAALSAVWLAPAGQSAPATQIAAAEEQED